MANLMRRTEDFSAANADWTQILNVTVTPNTHAAPSFAGNNAGLADTVTDVGATQDQIRNEWFPLGITTSTDYTVSLYIRKTFTAPAAFPVLAVQFITGGDFFSGVSIDTQTGSLMTAGITSVVAPVSSGVQSIDAVWWRVWFVTNSGTCQDLRPGMWPAFSFVHGDPDDATAAGSIVVWGLNVTQSSGVQAYEGDPAYSFHLPFFSQLTASFR